MTNFSCVANDFAIQHSLNVVILSPNEKIEQTVAELRKPLSPFKSQRLHGFWPQLVLLFLY